MVTATTGGPTVSEGGGSDSRVSLAERRGVNREVVPGQPHRAE